MDSLFEINKVYTVLELNTTVRKLIKDKFSSSVWVCGEIQDLRMSRDRKHIYFNFVQKDPDADQVLAKVSAAIFQGRKFQILKRLKESASGLELRNDIEVKLLCDVDLYPKNGNFSLIVSDIDPVYTLGKMAQSRQKIIEELKRKGLLEKNKQLVIPQLPLRVGLITSSSSAAYHDFTNELKISGFSFKVLACNCHMQGNLVEKDVMGALGYFNDEAKEKIDVIVITRGGGSTADLSYFDSKKIAESIAASKLPVISALGHEINTTITDLVAHTVCKTPTKAGQFLVEIIREVSENLNYLEEKIVSNAQGLLMNKKKHLENLTVKIESASFRFFRIHREEILEKKHKIVACVNIILKDEKDFLKRSWEKLTSTVTKLPQHCREHLEYLEGKIKILDPVNVLKRGYSITLKGKKAVASIKDIEKGDRLTTVFYKGNVESTVERKQSA